MPSVREEEGGREKDEEEEQCIQLTSILNAQFHVTQARDS